MSRPYDDMTEEEARRALSRRHHPDEGDPEDRRSRLEQFGYPAAPMAGGYAWPFLPPVYGGAPYDPDPYWRASPAQRRGAGREAHGGRSFMDRAADEVASWLGDEDAEARREEDHRGRGPKGYRRSDARIEEDVNDRLTDDRLVDAREITVSVADQEITLDGYVDSRRAKRRAEGCADSVSGVTHVQNNLRVRTAE